MTTAYCLLIVWCFRNTTPCLKKKQAKLFSLCLRQTSARSDNFWHKDGKQSKIIWGELIFHWELNWTYSYEACCLSVWRVSTVMECPMRSCSVLDPDLAAWCSSVTRLAHTFTSRISGCRHNCSPRWSAALMWNSLTESSCSSCCSMLRIEWTCLWLYRISALFPNPAEIRLRQKFHRSRIVLPDLKSWFFPDIR